MAMLTLYVRRTENDLPQTVVVDDSVFVKTLVNGMIRGLNLPKENEDGRPLRYVLASLTGTPLMDEQISLAHEGVTDGMHLILLQVDDTEATLPLPELPVASRTRWFSDQFARPRKERFVSLSGYLLLVMIALSGIGSGFVVALARHTNAIRLTTSPVVSHLAASIPTPLPHIALPVIRFTAHHGVVHSISWSSDGMLLASGGDDDTVYLWRPDGMIESQVILDAPIHAIAWSPSSTLLAIGAGETVTIVQSPQATLLQRIVTGQQVVTSLAWTGTMPSLLVSGGLDTRAMIWNIPSPQPQLVFQKHTTSIEASDSVYEDVTTSSQGGVIRVWNANTGQEVHGYFFDGSHPIRALRLSQGGVLAVGGDDGVIRLWNGLLCQHSGTSDFGVRCLDKPKRMQAQGGAVESLAWSPDGTLLASGQQDGSVTIWDVAHAVPLFSFHLPHTVASLSWSPLHAPLLAVASGDVVSLWRIQA